jgi:hypothetical protein
MSSVTKKTNRLLPIVGGIGIGLVVVIALIGMIHRSVEVRLSNGGFVRITPASLWGSCLFKTGCKIVYQPKDGKVGTVVLLQDSDSQLAMIMPASDGKSLLCLYDADVVLRLMRIDPAKNFKPFPEKSFSNWIVLASSWDVEQGTTNDWQEVSEYLRTVSPDIFNQEAGTKLDLGISRSHYEKDDLLPVVERQINNMQLYGSTY